MNAKLETLSEFYSDRLWFSFSDRDREEAWTQAKQFSTQVSRWTAYLNLLALHSVIPYLRENTDNQSLKLACSDRLEKETAKETTWMTRLWEFINGTAIEMGAIRIAIIPSDDAIADELAIPKEFIDIQQLCADYYLAAQINLEDRWICIWGYATHKQIKIKAEYDRWERTYLLAREDAIEDINVLWMSRECQVQEQEQCQVVALSPLSRDRRKNLLEQWGKSSAHSPRLTVKYEDFSSWATFLVDEKLRQALYAKRRGFLVELDDSLSILERIQKMLQVMGQQIEPVLPRSQGEIIPGYLNNPVAPKGYKGTKNITIELCDRIQELALTVALLPTKYQTESIDVYVEIHPTDGEQKLLPNLELKALNLHQGTIIAIQAEQQQPRMICRFSRKLQDPFHLQLKLENWEYCQTYSSL